MSKHIKRSEIGEKIREIRRAHGETQRQLARAINCTESAVANYETGYRKVDVQTLLLIARHYGLTVDDLIS